MSIKIENISKNFGSFAALTDVDLNIESGELVALLGPSGSGKTSLLRIIAGLEQPDQGNIYFGEQNMTDVEAIKRQVGFVFQHYALFSHMSVAENISYGLRVKPRKERPSKKEIKDKVKELLELVKLDGLENRYPSQLSGGQRQRVALARALAVQPKVLLLDEPFGALDAKVRKDLRRWLRKLHDEFHITSVFVTHDQEEALDVSDRVVVMNDGQIKQIGTPDEVYENPNSPFVFDFLGNVNIFKGRVHNGIFQSSGDEIYHRDIAATVQNTKKDTFAYTRPHQFDIQTTEQGEGYLPVSIQYIHAVGPIVFIEAKREQGDLIEIELEKSKFIDLGITQGQVVFVKPKQIKVFTPEEFSI
ncbi:sulfate ABC transporter ATP-binding protein [Alkalihalobacillus alcalophilus ATCC 27647 = CGMCC 1.3604]|uniref:Sulfate ABC transporter n=1 Tax=Alkalihalobacillus alcalophilus ATCC 27647 = CGMCC 1.3604 TaxID=1218173 RepID=J8TQ96_ALKAL|nr:sulfate/molybdate ABC transporter ATP-binding protein [Alkalihalobacillus alcalophilus]AFV25851.1 sulfate transporter [Alkalihalobacillus alcalophilus ATCC 27647 = CGMCC 1.3604]KGA98697.1 sulfate ABC transporter [Alkalihalobacillus alcalophilus ATCC 27647 = CGMCC 1.3604]MED1560323.1 sulfate/molybdate ABC transporter ATP-binding protein [Alkalihalobacillus alcalophilus]THG89768.1 sulfate ABC transporter ATP-binding protein [Alkalihalobacillus alcalophilus ATCC 27647 = CGMCC 1.3604]